jgi:hypothetical protein
MSIDQSLFGCVDAVDLCRLTKAFATDDQLSTLPEPTKLWSPLVQIGLCKTPG